VVEFLIEKLHDPKIVASVLAAIAAIATKSKAIWRTVKSRDLRARWGHNMAHETAGTDLGGMLVKLPPG